MDFHFYIWGQDLVPSIDGKDEESRVCTSCHATKRVNKCSIRRKVLLHSPLLVRGRTLSKLADDGRYFGFFGQ